MNAAWLARHINSLIIIEILQPQQECAWFSPALSNSEMESSIRMTALLFVCMDLEKFLILLAMQLFTTNCIERFFIRLLHIVYFRSLHFVRIIFHHFSVNYCLLVINEHFRQYSTIFLSEIPFSQVLINLRHFYKSKYYSLVYCVS